MTHDQDGDDAPSLWIDGTFTLRVLGQDHDPERVIDLARPFARIGHAADCDVRIVDPGVDARHAYLHLDERGLFVIDLVTRSGTHINGSTHGVGWLVPGQCLAVGGRTIELVEIRINGKPFTPPLCGDDLLDDAGYKAAELASVILEPQKAGTRSWSLSSELAFLGWSSACAIHVEDAGIARIHCALVRTGTSLYVVDLCGRQTTIDGQPVHGAAIVHEGQTLTTGATSFTVHIQPMRAARPPEPTAQAIPAPEISALVVRTENSELERAASPPTTLEPIAPDANQAFMTWLLDALRETHGALSRRDSEMHETLVQWLGQMHHDNLVMLDAQRTRIDSIDRELAALRASLARHQLEGSPAAAQLPAAEQPPALTGPLAPPLQIPKPPPEAVNTRDSAGWMLQRVSQLEDRKQSTWSTILNRLTASSRRAP